MLRPRTVLALALMALAASGCGSDDDAGDEGAKRAETPAAQACPPQSEQALEAAKAAMGHDDFDGAFAALEPYLDCPAVRTRYDAYRPVAASKTLKVAKHRLRESLAKPGPDASPQPAVSLARNSLRYKETAEGKAFLQRAEAELALFKQKYGDKPSEDDGGPPAGAGEGGPPDQDSGEDQVPPDLPGY